MQAHVLLIQNRLRLRFADINYGKNISQVSGLAYLCCAQRSRARGSQLGFEGAARNALAIRPRSGSGGSAGGGR